MDHSFLNANDRAHASLHTSIVDVRSLVPKFRHYALLELISTEQKVSAGLGINPRNSLRHDSQAIGNRVEHANYTKQLDLSAW